MSIIEGLAQILKWTKNIFLIGNNMNEIIENQKRLGEKLNRLGKKIDSPQNQLIELERIKITIDLLKENNLQEIKKLEADSTNKIESHKRKIQNLKEQNKQLLKYKKEVDKLIREAINIIKDKNEKIDELNSEIKNLKESSAQKLNHLPPIPPAGTSSLAYTLLSTFEGKRKKHLK